MGKGGKGPCPLPQPVYRRKGCALAGRETPVGAVRQGGVGGVGGVMETLQLWRPCSEL